MMVGYARVSSDAQDTALQLRAFKRAGIRSVKSEKRSGATMARPVLVAVLAALRPGDVLVVYKLDRLARSLADLLSILRLLAERGAGLRSLTEPIDTSTPLGEFIVQVLGAVAQFELALIRERVRAGRAAAEARGVIFGRKRKIDYAQAQAMKEGGATWFEVGEAFGVSAKTARSALYRVARGRTTVADPRQQT